MIKLNKETAEAIKIAYIKYATDDEFGFYIDSITESDLDEGLRSIREDHVGDVGNKLPAKLNEDRPYNANRFGIVKKINEIISYLEANNE